MLEIRASLEYRDFESPVSFSLRQEGCRSDISAACASRRMFDPLNPSRTCGPYPPYGTGLAPSPIASWLSLKDA
jgi:hypothetical protein